MHCCDATLHPVHGGLQSPRDWRGSWRVTTQDADQAAAGLAARGCQRAGRASIPREATERQTAGH